MSDAIITVENLGKKYSLRHQTGEHYTALRDVIANKASSLFRNSKPGARDSTKEDFWALKDVTFEVKRGDVLGIIGRNGAGKSTLLKILSRITEPTEGKVRIRGRVASLLEVGTGFHPELTGRENIYLNGAILGMARAEIKKKFDEIVAFAELEKFLDTAVKRYSSGMYVRLAFAVAAHLEPDILIVDEVLAVGDFQFQEKCLGKMEEVSRGDGRTVLFVSHDMRKVAALCQKGLLLKEGRIKANEAMPTVIATYIKRETSNDAFRDLTGDIERSGNGEAKFRFIELLKDGLQTGEFSFGEDLDCRVVVEVIQRFGASSIAILIKSSDGIPVHDLWNTNGGCRWPADVGLYEFFIRIPKIRLYPGSYSIDLWLGTSNTTRVDYVRDVLKFNIFPQSAGRLQQPMDRANGLVFHPSEWTFNVLAEEKK